MTVATQPFGGGAAIVIIHNFLVMQDVTLVKAKTLIIHGCYCPTTGLKPRLEYSNLGCK